jgi:hypothetical protein
VARKALRKVNATAQSLLAKRMDPQKACDLAEVLSQGVWTHDYPLMASDLEKLGLPVKVGVPSEERALMDLYPQPRNRQESVEYVPGPSLPRPRNRPAGPSAG